MQMHFLLTPHYFSASGLPKANVFVSKRGGCWQCEWQELQPVSSPCQRQTVIPPLLPSQADFTLPWTSLEERIPSSFNVPEPGAGTSPNAQQNRRWLFGRVILLQTFYFVAQLSFLHKDSTSCLSKGLSKPQRPESTATDSKLLK